MRRSLVFFLAYALAGAPVWGAVRPLPSEWFAARGAEVRALKDFSLEYGVDPFGLVSALPVGTTYYADWTSGADTNNGTSTSTPFKRFRGMPTCASNCNTVTPAAGDVFVLKGGETWPASALGWDVALYVGASGNRITIGSGDKTWFTGGSWTKPALDGGYTTLGGGDNLMYVVKSTSGGTSMYLTVQDIEYKNLLVKTNAAVVMFGFHGVKDLTISRVFMHGWDRVTGSGTRQNGACVPTSDCVTAVTKSDGGWGGIYDGYANAANNSNENTILEYSTIDNSENGGNQGLLTRGVEQLWYNTLRGAVNACLHGCRMVVGNTVTDIGDRFAGDDTHQNIFYSDVYRGTETTKPSSITAILAFNRLGRSACGSLCAGTAVQKFYMEPGAGPNVANGGTVNQYIFGNVVDDLDWVVTADPEFAGTNGFVMNVHVVNNTFKGVSGSATSMVKAYDRGAGTDKLALVRVSGNHIISDAGGGVLDISAATTTETDNNVTRTLAQAASDGYTAPNWAPPNGSAITVGAGKNFASLCGSLTPACSVGIDNNSRGATWDAGAYQFANAKKTASLPFAVH